MDRAMRADFVFQPLRGKYAVKKSATCSKEAEREAMMLEVHGKENPFGRKVIGSQTSADIFLYR